MTLFAQLDTGNRGSIMALSYTDGVLASESDRVVLETGSDYWALKIDGDYSIIYDTDGLLIGDFDAEKNISPPTLDFYALSSGVKQRMASLTKTGRLQTLGVFETATLPTGGITMLGGNVSITADGIYAAKVAEVWFITDNSGNYVCSNGQLIQAR